MRKTLLFLICLTSLYSNGQVNYGQRTSNYSKLADGGDIFDHNTDEIGLWANTGNKQVVAWRNFTDDGTLSGTPITMESGDSFEITLNATRAFGQIGIALLASPIATSTWGDRHNNYAAQVNLNGINTPNWEVISTGGTSNISTVNASTDYADVKFTFLLTSATEMTVSISKNNGTPENFNITLNNTNITGFSVYLADDWNGIANSNVYVKPNTSYTDASVLSNDIASSETVFYVTDNILHLKTNKTTKIEIYDLKGSLVKEFYTNKSATVLDLPKGTFAVKTNSKNNVNSKLVLIK